MGERRLRQPNGCFSLNLAHGKMVKQPVAILQADRLLLFCFFLIEMIEEGGDACERRFLLVFDLDGKFDFHFADATEVGNGL